MRSKGVSPGFSPRENLQPLKVNLRQQAVKSRGTVFAKDGKPENLESSEVKDRARIQQLQKQREQLQTRGQIKQGSEFKSHHEEQSNPVSTKGESFKDPQFGNSDHNRDRTSFQQDFSRNDNQKQTRTQSLGG